MYTFKTKRKNAVEMTKFKEPKNENSDIKKIKAKN